MIWAIFPLTVAILWAIIDIFDRHIIKDELRDPFLCTAIFGFASSVIIILGLIFGDVFSLSHTAIFILLLAGILYAVGSVFYYGAFQKEKISKLAPILPLRVVFITIFSFLVLSETLTFLQYLGIGILVSGAILISYKKGVKYKLSFAFVLMIACVFFRAIRDVFVRFGKNLGNSNILDVLFWIYLGYFLISIIIFLVHHPHILKKTKKGIEHLTINTFLALMTLTIYFYAISKFSVSLVAAVSSLTPLIVFILVFVFTKLNSKVIYEKFDKGNLTINLVASVLAVIGAILVLI